jgi:hypothetical protein
MLLSDNKSEFLRKNLFEQVRFTNALFGKNPITDFGSDQQHFDALASQVKLVREEFNELKDAVPFQFHDIRDAVCDVLVTSLGIIHLITPSHRTYDFVWDNTSRGRLPPSAFKSHVNGLFQNIDNSLTSLAKAQEFTPDITIECATRICRDAIQVYNLFVQNDLLSDMFAVFKSNLSKVCLTDDDRDATIEFYTTIGVKTYAVPCDLFKGWIVRVSDDCFDTNGKPYPRNKFLKSVGGFREPDFDTSIPTMGSLHA